MLTRLRQLLAAHERISPLLFAVAATAAILLLRQGQFLEGLELLLYDHYIAKVAPRQPPDPRILVVGITDDDLVGLGWPVSDQVLADGLDRLQSLGARTIGVDLYRDAPRPPGSERFDAVLRRGDNIIMVYKVGEGERSGVPPPAALRGTRQIGFADLPPDRSVLVHRGLLFLEQDGETHFGFALRLVLHYLRPQGIGLRPDADDPEAMRLGPLRLAPLGPNDGAYVNADVGGFQTLIDYWGGPAAFETVSFGDVLAGRLTAERVRDRLVVVGLATESVKDFFPSPFAGGNGKDYIFGMTIHAHIASQLLRGALDGQSSVRVLPGWAEALLTLLVALAAALVVNRRHVTVATVLPAAAIAAALYGLGWLAAEQRLWLPVLPPTLAAILAVSLVVAFRANQEKEQRQQLMQIFSRHVSPDVADLLWRKRQEFFEAGGRMVSQKITATVLFSDIRGFTTISESLPPQALMDWLNEYFDAMVDTVIRHGGTVDKFIGDAVMAVFGAPIVAKDEAAVDANAAAAVECALDMGKALDQLVGRWHAAGLPEIAIRVGIHTGPLVAGSLGGRNRLEYTVIGDTVNVASRLEGLGKESVAVAGQRTTILIGESTARRLGDRFRLAPVGAMKLKGKEELINVYQVIES